MQTIDSFDDNKYPLQSKYILLYEYQVILNKLVINVLKVLVTQNKLIDFQCNGEQTEICLFYQDKGKHMECRESEYKKYNLIMGLTLVK